MITALLLSLGIQAQCAPEIKPTEFTLRATLRFQEVDRKRYIQPLLAGLEDSHCTHSIPERRDPRAAKICHLLSKFKKKQNLEARLSSQELLSLQDSWSLLDVKASAWNLSSMFSQPEEGAELLISYLETLTELSANAEVFSKLVRELHPGRAQAMDELILPLLFADLKSPFLPVTAQEFFSQLNCLSDACQKTKSLAQYKLNETFTDEVRFRLQEIEQDIKRNSQTLKTNKRANLISVSNFAQKVDSYLDIVRELHQSISSPEKSNLSYKVTQLRVSLKSNIIEQLSLHSNLDDASKLELLLNVVRFLELRKFRTTVPSQRLPEAIERPDDLAALVEESKKSVLEVLLSLETALTEETNL